MFLPASAFAHKLIPTDGSNNDIVSALEIPDLVVSWAMYEELSNNVLYYKFDAKKVTSYLQTLSYQSLMD